MTDEQADALAIVQALPKLLGAGGGMPEHWAVQFAHWMYVFGPRTERMMMPDDVRRALAFIEQRVRGDQAEGGA